jgi:putative membrane fusion protein
VVYPSQDEINTRKKIAELNEQIATLSEARLFVGASEVVQSNAQIEAFSGQLSDTHLQILRSIASGDFERASAFKNDYLSLQGKINAVRGHDVGESLELRIGQLKSQVTLLEASLKGAVREIRVNEAGYFVNNADGYESVLRFDDALDVTREQVEGIIDNPSLAVGSNVAGKIIDCYKWRMAAIVDTDKTRGISKGNTVKLRIGTFPRTVQAQVISVDVHGDGTTLFVFECEYLDEEFVKKRVASVRLLLNDYSGIRIPQNAVVFRDTDGESVRGVYVKNGAEIVFRRVNMLRSDDDFLIVENTDKPGWLRLYDEIVVSGDNLYDGKIVGR